ncbi:hypothetical protein ACFQ1M_16660 [Sungkyunkwania multivorans]|uniref:Uncharacterized protein n=1 Tax=Sungkyunkwania multivorans TaxID=1173618 RepID=A0ABW3D198_9FLAO
MNNQRPTTTKTLEAKKLSIQLINATRVFIVFCLFLTYEIISSTMTKGEFTFPEFTSADFIMKMLFMYAISLGISRIYSHKAILKNQQKEATSDKVASEVI